MNLRRCALMLLMFIVVLSSGVSAVELNAGMEPILKQSADIDTLNEDFQVEIETVMTKIEGSIPDTVVEEYDEVGDGISWIRSVIPGEEAYELEDFFITRDENGNVISKTPVLGSKQVVEAIPNRLMYGGYVAAGSEFSPKPTTYGVDCVGCSGETSGWGGTAMGIAVSMDSVRQSNGEWQKGITYDGYYIIAADPAIPMGTIVTVYNHGYSGDGLQAGVPFKAIVGDRGGAIRGNRIDLFVGSQVVNNVDINYAINHPTLVIESVGYNARVRY